MPRVLAGVFCAVLAGCSVTRGASPAKCPSWISITTGWADYQTGVHLDGDSGALAGRSDRDTIDLAPKYGLSLRYGRQLSETVAASVGVGVRRFEPEDAQLLGATFAPDDLTTYRITGSLRYVLVPYDVATRWRPYLEADLAFVPGTSVDALVTYAPGVSETVSFDTGDHFSLGLGGGVSYQVAERRTIDIGVKYEMPLGSRGDSVRLDVPVPEVGRMPSTADVDLESRGFVVFVGYSVHF